MLPQYKRIASFGMKRTINKNSQNLAFVAYGSTDTIIQFFFSFQATNEVRKNYEILFPFRKFDRNWKYKVE